MVKATASVTLGTKLQRISERSISKPEEKFGKLMPLFNKANLIQCFHELKEDRAVGIDRRTKEEYSEKLDENIEYLIARMKSMSYRPKAVREVKIPKSDGGLRPLGISVVEDKIIQLMYAKLLEAVYEPHFLDCSYGFRPGRNCHGAIAAVNSYLYSHWRTVVIDADIRNYFGTIDHKMLLSLLREKIDDERFLRNLARMLKAGVLGAEGFRRTTAGSPQGAICSPIISNIYAHYVLDLWVESEVKPRFPDAQIIRYADDFVICCDNERSVRSIMAVLGKRLAKFSLELHPDKTKVVDLDKRSFQRGQQQGSFSFLGFTAFLARSRRGSIVPRFKTDRKRLSSGLKEMNRWLKSRRSKDFCETWNLLRKKLAGYARYYGVSNNARHVSRFIRRSETLFFKWMNRRSQKRSMTWEQFEAFRRLNPNVKPLIHFPLFPRPNLRKV